MYVLPTGGNFDLSSNMYYENYRTTLSQQGNGVLKRNQVYSRFMLSFNQAIFTASTLKENMKTAELNYRKSVCYYTCAQMDIIYNVTSAFYEVYRTAFENKINEDKLANSKEAYRIAKMKMEMGDLPEGDLLTTEIVVGQDESRLLESQGKLESSYDDFKLLIGLNISDSIELVADMEFESFLVDMQKAIEEGIRNRMEIIPRGRGKIEVRANSLYYEITTGKEVSMDITVRNAGRRRLDNIKISTEKPLGWQTVITPEVIKSLDPEKEEVVKIQIIPSKDSGVGAQEVKIKTDAMADNRKVETEDKTVRIQVNASTSVFGNHSVYIDCQC